MLPHVHFCASPKEHDLDENCHHARDAARFHRLVRPPLQKHDRQLSWCMFWVSLLASLEAIWAKMFPEQPCVLRRMLGDSHD